MTSQPIGKRPESEGTTNKMLRCSIDQCHNFQIIKNAPKCTACREHKSMAGDDSASTARREVNHKASAADPKAIFFHFFPFDSRVPKWLVRRPRLQKVQFSLAGIIGGPKAGRCPCNRPGRSSSNPGPKPKLEPQDLK